ncbi:unnamed protein product [Phytophthora lilii]|uniref:Unnamed protein product n=1 Tax=Phytophthora lilii TaxID=2077276 RepID=A0A9W6TK64_9STRA|nr:unnamed protein product [Phytophthora lilii]
MATSNKSASTSPTAAPGSPSAAADVDEPLVKKRRTKNFQLRENLAKSRGCVAVSVPPFEPQTFESWDAFIQAWTDYTARTKTMYRRRSSSTTTYWNSKHKFKKYPVPEDFKVGTSEWMVDLVLVEQIAQHNHRISDEIYNCYANNSSVPDELLLGPDVDLQHKQEPQQGADDSGKEWIDAGVWIIIIIGM